MTHDEKLAIDQLGVNHPFAASPDFVERVGQQLEEYNALRMLEGQLPVELLACTETGRRAPDGSFEPGAFRVFVPREAGASASVPEAPSAPPTPPAPLGPGSEPGPPLGRHEFTLGDAPKPPSTDPT